MKADTPVTKILVPISGCSEAAESADYAIRVAKAINADVIVLQIIKPGKAKEAGELSLEYFTDAGEKHGVQVESHFREGAIIHQIVDFAEECGVDLIVMGASKGRVIDQWISSDVRGSTAIPVLVIPFQIFD